MRLSALTAAIAALLSLLLLGCNGAQELFGGRATAICNDGTKSYSKNCSGTCSGHGGVRQWLRNDCGGGSGGGSGSTYTGPIPVADDVSGRWSGTMTKVEAQWPGAPDALSLDLTVDSKGVVTGTYRDPASGRSGPVTGGIAISSTPGAYPLSSYLVLEKVDIGWAGPNNPLDRKWEVFFEWADSQKSEMKGVLRSAQSEPGSTYAATLKRS